MADLTDEAADGETVTRFARFGDQVRGNRPRRNLFLPPPHGELSAFRTIGMTDDEISAAGVRIVETGGTYRFHGGADLLASEYRAEQLTVRCKDDDLEPRHATILGWPARQSDATYAAQKQVAERLAKLARFRARID